VLYGHSDFTQAVNWLLNEDTEAADVMASGKEFHFRIVRGANDFWYSVDLQCSTRNLCCVTVHCLAFFLCSAQMLAIRQSAGTTPKFSDWLNMKVSIPEISLHVSYITRGDMSSAPSDCEIYVTEKLTWLAIFSNEKKISVNKRQNDTCIHQNYKL